MGPMLFRFPKLPPGVSEGTQLAVVPANTLRRLPTPSYNHPPPPNFDAPRCLGMGPSPVFMPVISQPSQFTATAACSAQTSRHTACQAH